MVMHLGEKTFGYLYFIIPFLSLLVGWMPSSRRVSDRAYGWIVLMLTGVGWKLVFLRIYASLPFVQKMPFMREVVSFLSGVPLSITSYRLIGIVYTVFFSAMGLIFFEPETGEPMLKRRQKIGYLNGALIAFLVIFEAKDWSLRSLGIVGAVLMLYRLVAWPLDGPYAFQNGRIFLTGMGGALILLGGAIGLSPLPSYQSIAAVLGVSAIAGLFLWVNRLVLPSLKPLSVVIYPYGCLLLLLWMFMAWGEVLSHNLMFVRGVTLLGGGLMAVGSFLGFLSPTFHKWRQSFRWMAVGLVVLIVGHYPPKVAFTVMISVLCVESLWSFYIYIFGDNGSPMPISRDARGESRDWLQKGGEWCRYICLIGLVGNALGIIPYGTGWGMWNVLGNEKFSGDEHLSLFVVEGLFFLWSLLICHGALVLYNAQSSQVEMTWRRLRLFQGIFLINAVSGLIGTAYPWETIFVSSKLSLGPLSFSVPYIPTYGIALGFNFIGGVVYALGFQRVRSFQTSVPFRRGRWPMTLGISYFQRGRAVLQNMWTKGEHVRKNGIHVLKKTPSLLQKVVQLLQMSDERNDDVSVGLYRYLFFLLGIVLVVVLYGISR